MRIFERSKIELLRFRFWKQPERADRNVTAGRFLMNLGLAILVGFAMLAAPVLPAVASPPSFAIGVSVSFGPPPIPYYAQPLCPGPAYIWTPGYWAWDPAYGYYWVPGTWVPAPFVGALCTPGYWGGGGDAFFWHPGYWGTSVGFYGGINYGFGYTGYGYEGGYWRDRDFYYNRRVNNVNVRNVTYVYNRTVVNNGDRISYNGGRGGIEARPTPEQIAAARQRRMGAANLQVRQRDMARQMPQERASVNHGRPQIAATRRPGDFSHNAVRATRAGGHYVEPPISRATARPRQNVNAGRRHFGQPQSRTQQELHGHANAPRPGFQRFGQPQPRMQQRPSPQQRQAQGQRQPNWHQFGEQRGKSARMQQPPRNQQRQAPRYQRQAPAQFHPQMRRQPSPPPRRQVRNAQPHYQQRSAPRAQNAPRGRASNNNGHPPGRRH